MKEIIQVIFVAFVGERFPDTAGFFPEKDFLDCFFRKCQGVCCFHNKYGPAFPVTQHIQDAGGTLMLPTGVRNFFLSQKHRPKLGEALFVTKVTVPTWEDYFLSQKCLSQLGTTTFHFKSACPKLGRPLFISKMQGNYCITN